MGLNIKSRIHIIGAGLAGISIAREIQSKGIFGRVVAFLDDDHEKIGKRILGIPILGPIEDVTGIIKTTPEDEALIAIPSGTRDQLLRIYTILKKAGFLQIRILPGLSQILEGNAHLIQTREINPEDFLSRTPINVSLKESLSYIRGKRVLITGAGGSIGSELCRQLLYGEAERLYLFGHGENSVFDIERELKLLQEEGVGEKATIVPVIGELQDYDYMEHLVKRLKAEIVIHTAAHKHVPLMEANPVAAVLNNFFGTMHLLEASLKADVERFVMISTDKAVNPTNVYGASKFLAEELVLRARRQGKHAIIVRFGNVLGSRGSILPLFKKQILKGGPVTITHPEATRFFMTIPEAATLVLKAGGVDVDADLLLLDMGEPVNIKELASQMIRFYGYEPEKDIKFEYTGLRPGEKIQEHLWPQDETPVQTEYPKILKLSRKNHLNSKLKLIIDKLSPICFYNKDNSDLYRNRLALKRVLREYIPSMEVWPDEPEY